MKFAALVMMGAIFVISILFGRGQQLKSDPHSEAAWAILIAAAIILEAYLLIARDHTLSGQMQYWIKHDRLSGLFVVFWGWIAYHFVLEPTVRWTQKLIALRRGGSNK